VPYLREPSSAELNLNPFRGEPAISGFDWHFTPTHSSSVQFCNIERCAPPVRVTGPSRWPWVAHPVSGLLAATPLPREEDALFGLAVAAGAALKRPLPRRDEQLAGSFFNRHAISPGAAPEGGRVRPLADCGQTVSGTLSLPSPGCFSPFPRGTRALSVARCIEPWTVGGPASRGVPRVPRYSRTGAKEAGGDRLRGCHPLRRAVPGASPPLTLADSPRPRQRPPRGPSNPPAA
jgi:hypothetical protein